MEDNPADVRIVQEMIQDIGLDAQLTTAKDGDEALSYLDDGAERPDLVLVDLKLPKLGGLGLLRFIKEKGLTIKVVILTGSIYDMDRKEAHRLGVDVYLIKPTSIAEFDRTTLVLKEIIYSL